MRQGEVTTRASDLALGVAAVALGSIALVALGGSPLFDRMGPGPGLAPSLVAAALIACGATLVARSALRR
jgi:hypothetical protein